MLLSYAEFINESSNWKEFEGSLVKKYKNGSVIINQNGNVCNVVLKYDGYSGGEMDIIEGLSKDEAIKKGEEFLKDPKKYFETNESVNEAISSNGLAITMLIDAAQKVGAKDFSNKQKAERSWNAIKAYYDKNPYHFGTKLINSAEFQRRLFDIVKDPCPDPDSKETNMAVLIQVFFTDQQDLAKEYNGGKEIPLALPSEAQRKKEAAEFKKAHNVREISDNAKIEPLDLEIDGYKVDSEKTWICRTKDGRGPTVVMDDIDIEEDRHLVRRFYSWTYKVNYYSVRECRAKYWIENPDKRYSTME